MIADMLKASQVQVLAAALCAACVVPVQAQSKPDAPSSPAPSSAQAAPIQTRAEEALGRIKAEVPAHLRDRVDEVLLQRALRAAQVDPKVLELPLDEATKVKILEWAALLASVDASLEQGRKADEYAEQVLKRVDETVLRVEKLQQEMAQYQAEAEARAVERAKQMAQLEEERKERRAKSAAALAVAEQSMKELDEISAKIKTAKTRKERRQAQKELNDYAKRYGIPLPAPKPNVDPNKAYFYYLKRPALQTEAR
jgi:hypothetical protein